MVWMIWDLRTRWVFDGIHPRLSGAIASFWAFMRVANLGNLGCMHNTAFNFEVLSSFGITCRPSKAPIVFCIRWQPPPYRIMKVNVDGGAAGSPDRLTGGGGFQDSFGMFRGCFAASFGLGFAIEAELPTAFTALDLAFEKHWNSVWLETDSTYVVHVLKARPLEVPWRLLA
ncbi:hypothetical protein ACS0TY_017346 [Phlomoides rotata]